MGSGIVRSQRQAAQHHKGGMGGAPTLSAHDPTDCRRLCCGLYENGCHGRIELQRPAARLRGGEAGW